MTTHARPKSTSRRRLFGTDARWAVFFVAPMCVGLGLFYLWPAIGTLFTSFTETGPFGGWTWIGIDNYLTVFESPQVARALLNTLVYSSIVLISVPLALVIASLMATRGLRSVWLFRLAYFLPVITLPVAIGWIWKLLYNGDFGPLNIVLSSLGLPARSWLADGNTALVAISIVGIWMTIGYPIVLFTAALQNVPEELHEAAALDGAGPVRRFLNITVPMVSPTIFFVVVLTLIGTLQMFDLVFVMIGDRSPVRYETQTIIYLFYKSAFIDNHRGLGSAIVVCLMVIIMMLTYLQFRLQKKWVHYE